MIKKSILFTAMFTLSCQVYATEYLTLLTDRSALHVEPLVKMFEQEHNAKISIVYTKEGTIRNRIQDQSIDVVYATEVTEIEEVEPYLAPIKKSLDGINPELTSKTNKWVSPSYRIRGAYHKKDVEISTWDDLKNQTVCIRPMNHPYNISLFQAISKERIHVDQFIVDFYKSVNKPTNGNDRKQAQLMHKGQCSVAILNSYYVKVMNSDPVYADVVQNKTFTPITINGKYVALQSAVGVVKDSSINHNFVEFMLDKSAQKFITEVVGEYSYTDKRNIVTASHLNTRKEMFEVIESVTK